MGIQESKFVDKGGRVYLPYLAEWKPVFCGRGGGKREGGGGGGGKREGRGNRKGEEREKEKKKGGVREKKERREGEKERKGGRELKEWEKKRQWRGNYSSSSDTLLAFILILMIQLLNEL